MQLIVQVGGVDIVLIKRKEVEMIYIRDPIAYSFHSWMNQSPFSGHTLDMNRFYEFAKTVAKSRKK